MKKATVCIAILFALFFRPALAIEKEVKRDEISTGLYVGVEKLEGKMTARQPVDNTHNTKYLLKQYRRVAYAVEISESELNLRMEMEHGRGKDTKRGAYEQVSNG